MPDINRSDALALLATQDINEIVQEATESSAALSTFRTLRMSAGQARMPVLAALPTAGFVGESATAPEGVKPVSKVSWDRKELIAEEIACIVPVHENVLDDSNFDIWGEVRGLVAQEFGRVLDGAVLWGTNKPATWTDAALVPGAISAGNVVEAGSSGVDLAEDINQTFAEVEDDAFDVNVAYTGRFMRSRLRGLRDNNGQFIYLDGSRSDGATPSIYGQDLQYVGNGTWDRDQALLLAGDRQRAILGIRQDVQVKVLDQATIETDEGTIHLAQRDMVALRFKFRVGFATAWAASAERNGINNAYPFAVLTPEAAGSGE